MAPDDPPLEDPHASSEQDRRPRTGPSDYDETTATVDGYVIGDVIGRGGLGEIVAALDMRIGRDVAIKRLHAADPTPEQVTRFLREARIQARLDHPAIAPVHELGADADGRPFFTMKRVAGVTMKELLAAPEPNRQRLLRAFAEVCQAIDFAHQRGVVHRDLKPANIMLGDFGDVYVLDWGLARVVGEAVAEVAGDDLDGANADLLGTPGYMAPEQLQHAAEAGRPADVYALGSILFELLAGEALHPRGASALASTIAGEVVTSPARGRPDRGVPPELDSICTAMLSADPVERPTARKVAERIQAYLDGDRDVARRKTMAVDLLWAARAARDDGRRAEAMRAAGRALALDPESTGAAELITSLVLEPPKQPPVELERALHEADAEGIRRHARTAIHAYLALAAFMPITVWNGVRRWEIVTGVFGIAIAMALAAWEIRKRPVRSFTAMMVYALGNVALLGMLTRLAGPFIFVPAVACVVTMSVMAYPTFLARPAVLIATMVAGFLLPIALEQVGVLRSTWEVRGGVLINHAGALELGGTPTLVTLVGACAAAIGIAGVNAARIYRANRDAQLQLVTQAWHLRQLLPTPAG